MHEKYGNASAHRSKDFNISSTEKHIIMHAMMYTETIVQLFHMRFLQVHDVLCSSIICPESEKCTMHFITYYTTFTVFQLNHEIIEWRSNLSLICSH